MPITADEVWRRMAGMMTVWQVCLFAKRLAQNGVELPSRPGSEARKWVKTLTPHPQIPYVAVDQYGRYFVAVGPEADFRSGRCYEEGPWECCGCEDVRSGGWARSNDRLESLFQCNRCVWLAG
jgi:hypothetical protein